MMEVAREDSQLCQFSASGTPPTYILAMQGRHDGEIGIVIYQAHKTPECQNHQFSFSKEIHLINASQLLFKSQLQRREKKHNTFKTVHIYLPVGISICIKFQRDLFTVCHLPPVADISATRKDQHQKRSE